MKIRILRYFVAVVGAGSLTAAARVLGITQPSLSRQMRQLEDELGAELFRREGRGLVLTPAGRRFLPVAKDVLTRVDRALTVMADFRGTSELLLTVAANTTTLDDILAPFAAQLSGNFILDLVSESTTALNHLVREGAADLAISAMPSMGDLTGRLLGHFPVFACVRDDHPWARRSRVELAELASEPLILLRHDSVARRIFDDAVAETSGGYQIAFEVSLARAAQALASCGRGVAIVTDETRFGLQRLPIYGPGGWLSVPLFATWDPAHYAGSRIATLVDDLRRYCRDYVHDGLDI